MAIAYSTVGVTGATVSATAPAVVLPTGLTTDDMAIMFVTSKPFGATISQPSGWTSVSGGLGGLISGSVVGGNATGSQITWAFYRTGSTAATTLSLANGANSTTVHVLRFTKTSTDVWATPLGDAWRDDVVDTSMSITVNGQPTTTGDYLAFMCSYDDDVASPGTSRSFTQSGSTIGTVTVASSQGATTGNDVGMTSYSAPINAGSSSSSFVWTQTMVSASDNAAWVVRLRAAPPVPTITSLSRTYDVIGGGASVVITGTDFTGTTGAAGVTFGGTNATSYTVDSAVQITATAPAHARGLVDVVVTAPGGANANTSADDFYYMNAFEAVPAGGTWATAGTWAGGAAPTTSSDVYLGAGSGSVTLDASATCRSLNCLGYIATLTCAGNSLAIGDGTAGAGNVALDLPATMTLSAAAAAISLASTSVTQQSISTGISTLGSPTLTFTSGSYQLLTTLTTSGLIRLVGVTLDTNSQTVTSLYLTMNAGTKTLTLGSTSWTVTSGVNPTVILPASLTITANTATFTMTGASATFTGGGTNFNGMSLNMFGSGTATITGANTFKNLSRNGSANKTDELVLGADQTLASGSFTVGSNSSVNRVLVRSDVLGTARSISGSLNVAAPNYADFRDITAGTPTGFSGTFAGDCGGNTNITFPAATTCYAKMSGTSNWSDAIWFTTSGGSTAVRVPLPQDTAVIDANSGAFTLSRDMPRVGSVDLTAFTAGFAPSPGAVGVCECYGSLTVGTGVTLSGVNSTWTLGGRSSFTVTMAGKTWPTHVTINAPSGTYTLQDALTTASDATVDLKFGTLDLNGQTLTTLRFASTTATARTLRAAGATINLFDTNGNTLWNVLATNLTTVGLATSTIVITTASTAFRTFAGAGLSYGTFSYIVSGSTGRLNVTGANTFDTFNFTDSTQTRILAFTGTQTFANFNVFGTSNGQMQITSATFVKTGGIVSVDWLTLTNVTATPAVLTWYAGANSSSGGGNTGWIFTVPPERESPSIRISGQALSRSAVY